MSQKIQFTGDNPQPRFGHTINMIQKHRAVLFGGAVGDTGKYIITGDTFICDIVAKKWKKLDPKGTPPSNRAAHCSVFIDSCLLVYGGALGGGQLADDLLYQLDLKNGQDKAVWTIKTSEGQTPGRRYGHVMVYLKPYIVVFGGNTGSQPVNDVWTFDFLERNNWAKINTGTQIPQPRVYHSAALCRTGSANGMMVIFGGRTTDQSALNDTWGLRKHRDGRLDWVKAPYKSNGQVPKARYQHSTIFLGTLMLVVGGRNNNVGQTLPFDIYDTETSQWFKLSSIERFRHACWIADTFLYVHAGFDQDSPNVPTQSIIRIDLSKAFLPYNVLFKGLTFETGKDYHSFTSSKSPASQQSQNKPSSVYSQKEKEQNIYPQSQNIQRQQKIPERMEIESQNKNRVKKPVNNKPIKLCPDVIVASYDYNDQQVIKKVAINQLMQQNKRLKDPVIIPNTKEYFQKIYTSIINALFLKPISNPFSAFTSQIIFNLFEQIEKIVESEPTLLRLRAPVKIFGDLHGQLTDLNRLFQTFGAPSDENPLGDIQATDYLFLGDYVDRGTKSVQVILLLFALKLKYPQNIHLLRGSHQDRKINKSLGFGDECIIKFKQDLDDNDSYFNRINKIFQKLPLAALVEDKIFCVHGGIGNTLKNLNQIDTITRPCQVNHDPKTQVQKIVYDLLWSDPAEEGQQVINNVHDYFKTKQNLKYGPARTSKFCYDNNIAAIIRSHQPVQGIHKTENNIITIFSCTDYCGQGNCAGIVTIKRSEEVAPKLLPGYLTKEQRWWASEELSKNGRIEQQGLRKLAVTPPKK